MYPVSYFLLLNLLFMAYSLITVQRFFSNYILRKVYKLIYKYSHPKSYKHNRRYWPYYQVERAFNDDLQKIYFKKQLIVDNTQVNFSPNRKCMLIATGPSVHQLEKSYLQQLDIDYLGVNGAIALTDVKFKYYVIIDHNFTHNRFDLVEKVLKTPSCTLFTTPRCLDLILRKIKFENIICDIKVVEPITEGEIERFLGERIHVTKPQNYFHIYNHLGFSSQIFNAVYDYFTVAYVALQITYYLKYKDIYIAGLDMNNFSQPRFYEDKDNKQPTMLNQYLDVTLPAFHSAASFLKSQKINVYNLSQHSAVDAFKKIYPEQLQNTLLTQSSK